MTARLLRSHAAARRPLVSVTLAGALLLGACGGGDAGSSAPPTSMTGRPTTTSESTTTTRAPTDDELVRELVLGYRTAYTDIGRPNDPDHPLIRAMFTDPMLSRVQDILGRNAAEGSYYEGGYDMKVLDVALDGDAGVVRTCAHDRITKRAADGSVLLPPAPAPFELDFQVQRTADGWRIAETVPYEAEPCVLG